MLPVTYEPHCKACHPLTFDPKLPDVQVPHLLQPAQVTRFLWGVYTESAVEAVARKPAGNRPLPGENIGRLEKEERERIKGRAEEGATFLFSREHESLDRARQFVFEGRTTCGLCHHYERKPNAKVPEKIVPPALPQVWYTHATFNHAAHKAVQCVDCHDAKTSRVSSDVLLPGVENCRTCHAPASGALLGKKSNEPRHGGVRHDCVTCHRYHNGDAAEAGLGAVKRGADRRRSLQEFLEGK
jgi:hypothetical protein